MKMKYVSKVVIYVLLVIFSSTLFFPKGVIAQKKIKKRIAVFVFDDKTEHRHRWWTGQSVGEGMSDMLVTALVKKGNYQVIERKEIDKIMSEQKLGQSGVVTQQSAAQVGKMLGVELAIFGAVTEFGYKEGTTGGRLKKKAFGLGIKSTSATVGLDIRFVNTTTGEILMAESVRKEESSKGLSLDTKDFSFGNQKKFDDSIVGKATREAINTVVDYVDNTAPTIPWQAKIIKGDGPIFINVGAIAGVEIGDEFAIYRPGEELVDPDTGISLGAVESKVGRIKVTNNNIGNGKASQCTALTGSGFQRNDLVRIK